MGQDYSRAANSQGSNAPNKPPPMKREPPVLSRFTALKTRRRVRKGPDPASKLPTVTPTARSRLKCLKTERIQDWLLLEEECIRNMNRPISEEKQETEELRSRVDEIRGTPMITGTLEEFVDDDHVIVSSKGGVGDTYVRVMSFVDKEALRPNCSLLLSLADVVATGRVRSVVGLLDEEVELRASVLKLEKAPPETYADVGGLESEIEELKEAVELPMTRPELYSEMGISPPKGVILYGPPGTGKTLLARAVAHHTSATFLRVVGSELIQKHSGDGPKLIRDIFHLAELYAPSIIFFDEIDAVGTKRYETSCTGEQEVQRTLLELLNQLDGFDTHVDVRVILATNRIDSLDPALIRPGRIDRKIEIPLPDDKNKRKIFALHSGNMNLSPDVSFEEFLTKEELSGADIKAICSEAGMLALRKRSRMITMGDFRKAADSVLMQKKEGFEGLYL